MGLGIESMPLEEQTAHHGGVVCGLWLCCRNANKGTIPT
jgi:hypothetical protein